MLVEKNFKATLLFISKSPIMYFLFSAILILNLNAQNFQPSWTTARNLKRTARSGNSFEPNGTSESWMDGLNENEIYHIMQQQEFALSAKLYPDKLKLLHKAGLHFNRP